MTPRDATKELMGQRVQPYEPDLIAKAIDEAITFGCSVWGLTKDELKKQTRSPIYSLPRHSIMYAIKECLPNVYWSVISNAFDTKHDTTIYGVNRIRRIKLNLERNKFSVNDRERVAYIHAAEVIDFLKDYIAKQK